MIAYKVVHDPSRYGSNAAGYIQSNKHGMKGFKNLLRNYPALKKYFQTYIKGKIVHAAKNSVGICCFAELDHAEYFAHWEGINNIKIIRVRGIGRRPRPNGIVPGCAYDPRDLLCCSSNTLRKTNHSWLFFSAVEVLE